MLQLVESDSTFLSPIKRNTLLSQHMCSVVSIASFEGVFCESDVFFRSVIVVTFDGCSVDN